MTSYIGISTLLIISIMTSFLLSFPIIHILYKVKITRRGDVDFSNLIEERKKKVGTPIMGGLIVILTVIILNMIFNRNVDNQLSGSIKMPLLIIFISALLGAFDDILNIYGKERKVKRIRRVLTLIKVHKNIFKRAYYICVLPWLIYKRIFFLLGSNPGKGIQAHEKILVQSIVGGLLAYWLIYTAGWTNPYDLWLPIFGWVYIGIMMIPFIIFTVLAMSNAVNLSDGMDGLATGLLISSFGGLLVISIAQINAPMIILNTTLIGSLITYLYFNAPPARFQMGDVGSLALGAILAVIAFELRVPLILPIIGFPFVAEVGSSLIQGIGRRVFGRRVFKMAPLHHHFEMRGWSEEKVVIRFWIYGILSSVIGVWTYFIFY